MSDDPKRPDPHAGGVGDAPPAPPAPPPGTVRDLRPEDCEVRWARDLIPLLRESGTGEDKLAVLAELITARFDHEDVRRLGGRDARRHLTSAEACKALAEDVRTKDKTAFLEKCRQLALTGRYVPPPTAGPAAPSLTIPMPPDDGRRKVASAVPPVQGAVAAGPADAPAKAAPADEPRADEPTAPPGRETPHARTPAAEHKHKGK